MKKILIIIAVLCVFSVSAFASATKLAGMNIPAQLSKTDQLIFYYPSEILNFWSEAVLEYNGGAIGYALFRMKSSSLGIALVPSPGLGAVVDTADLDIAVLGTPSLDLPNNVICGVYGMYLGKTGVGISVMYGSLLSSSELQMTAAVTDKEHQGIDQTYLKIGLGATLNIGMPLDVGVSIALPGYYSNPKIYSAPTALVLINNSYEKMSGMSINAGIRTIIDSMIFNLSLNYATQSAESNTWLDPDADAIAETNMLYTSSNSAIDVALLAANRMEISKTLDILVGAGLGAHMSGSSKDKTENKVTPGVVYGTAADSSTTIGLPVYISADCNLNDTFTLTAGINKQLATITMGTEQTVLAADGTTVQDKTTSTTLDFDGAVSLATGLTATYGDVKIDLLFNLDWFAFDNQSLTSMAGLTYTWK